MGEVAQSCPTLCDLMDCSLPGSSVMGFSRQEYWSGSLFPSPGDLPDPGIKPRSPTLQADSLPSELPGKSGNGWRNVIKVDFFLLSSKVTASFSIQNRKLVKMYFFCCSIT